MVLQYLVIDRFYVPRCVTCMRYCQAFFEIDMLVYHTRLYFKINSTRSIDRYEIIQQNY